MTAYIYLGVCRPYKKKTTRPPLEQLALMDDVAVMFGVTVDAIERRTTMKEKIKKPDFPEKIYIRPHIAGGFEAFWFFDKKSDDCVEYSRNQWYKTSESLPGNMPVREPESTQPIIWKNIDRPTHYISNITRRPRGLFYWKHFNPLNIEK